MLAKTYVVEKQIQWAQRHCIPLVKNPKTQEAVGAWQGEAYRTAYTEQLIQNLEEPLSEAGVAEFNAGDGGELGGKMRALYSSSALAANIGNFHKRTNTATLLLTALGLKNLQGGSLRFEQQRPIMDDGPATGFPRSPHLDLTVDIQGPQKFEVAVECKFIEPYRDPCKAFKTRYFDADVDQALWGNIPNCKALALAIGVGDEDRIHRHLHAAQLLKHILGLKHRNGVDGFVLVYLWYDAAGAEAKLHSEEVAALKKVVEQDGVRFIGLTCQELILNLSNAKAQMTKHVDYLSDRYL